MVETNIPKEIIKDLQSVCQLHEQVSVTMINVGSLVKAYQNF